jgi:hypothetical protein
MPADVPLSLTGFLFLRDNKVSCAFAMLFTDVGTRHTSVPFLLSANYEGQRCRIRCAGDRTTFAAGSATGNVGCIVKGTVLTYLHALQRPTE